MNDNQNHNHLQDGQDVESNPLGGPKLVAPKPKYNFDFIPEDSTSTPQSNPSSPPQSGSSPFFSPLYSIPQRQSSPSPSPASQIQKPPSRTSLRSSKPDSTKTPTPNDLALFESHCKSSFGLVIRTNQQDGHEELSLMSDLSNIDGQERLEFESRQKFSQSFVDRVLSNCPAAHRATYNRIQSKVRQLYHSQVEISRQRSLNLLIQSIEPNSKLTNFSRNHLHSIPSRIERRNLLREFLSNHCSKNKVGIHPFLASIKFIFNLQCRSSGSGGGGPLVLVWRMDDAVLMETGGEVFMKDSIELLKGTFGFTETRVNSSDSRCNAEDPFKDHQIIASNPNNLEQNKRSSLIGGPGSTAPGFSNSPPTYLRLWYVPKHLTNPELSTLAREIPKFVVSSARNPPRLKSISDKELTLTSSNSQSRLEQGTHHNGIYSLSSNEDVRSTITSLHSASSSSKDESALPTGSVFRSDPIDGKRDKGWKGTLIQRLLNWLRSLAY